MHDETAPQGAPEIGVGNAPLNLVPFAPKRRWFRFSLRTLFVVVAVVAIGLFLGLRARSMRKKSDEHLMTAAMFQEVVSGIDRLPSPTIHQKALRDGFQAKLNYHADLSLRYEEAIWRPWVLVDDGQPPP